MLNARKKIIPLLTALLVPTLLLPANAYAYGSDNVEMQEIQQTLHQYSQELLAEYHSPRTRSKLNIPLTAEEQAKEGLISKNVEVVPTIRSIQSSDDGEYLIDTDMTVNVSLDADSDTVIYVNGKRTDHLDQSWTSTHIMEFAHVGRQRGYSIISDKVIDEQDPPEYADASDKLPTEDKTPASLDENGALESEALNKAQTYAFGDNSVGVNYIKAMNYANKWTSPGYEHKMNSAYPSFGSNCANSVSQALHEGGMTLTRLWNYSTVLPDKLTTRAWMNADSNYSYMKHYSHSYDSLDNVWKAWQGSILYVDWTSNNEIDHAMFVVGVVVKDGKANPVIDQKTENRHQITLTESLQHAHEQGKNNMTWYGLQYRYD